MPDYTSSPNMGLRLPIVGQDPGPTWATDLNASLSSVDGHDHTTGYGVQITPAGININTDLTFGGNDATDLRSTRYTVQNSLLGAASDLGCLYVSGVDLYYNDVDGNQIRLTQSGSIVGTSGSITGLVSPASASYSAGSATFVWQSAANTPANMDGGSFIFRNISASSKGVTVSAGAALAADYTLTLPALPASQKIMTLDNAGLLSAPYTVDNATIVIQSNVIGVPNNGINDLQIKLRNQGWLRGSNAAASGTVNIVEIDGSDKIAFNYADLATASAIGLAGTIRSQTFNSSGTFTVPTNVSYVLIFAAGGGGGGGTGANNTGSGGGGGGAGALPTLFPYAVTPGGSVSVTIGAGGAGASSFSANGATGGSTIIDSYAFAGGPGGSGTATGTGGAGGVGGWSPNVQAVSGGAGGAAAGAGSSGTRSQFGSAGTGGTPTVNAGGGGGGAGFGSGQNGGGGGASGGSAAANSSAGGGGAGSGNSTAGNGGSGFAKFYWVTA